MENEVSVKNESTNSYSIFSAATHPSVRNKDDLLRRIRSGNDVLCRIPERLDPNIQFSEDDDDEDVPHKEDNKSPLKDLVNKTPELRLKKSHHTLPAHGFPPARLSSVKRAHFSATKPPTARLEKMSLPQSEQRIRTKEPLHAQRSSKNLMLQPEFEAPSRDTIVVNGRPYTVLSLLGTGGSCKVFSCYDRSSRLVAVKCVALAGTDPLIRAGYEREIEYLKNLQGSDRVIHMIDHEYRRDKLLLVLERGEIDFGRYISHEAKLQSLTPLTVQFFWSQMLEAVSHIHRHGIVHSDLKPANFLLVEGRLKLIDFGIATQVPQDTTSALRDTQVGTLNYMSPEAVTQLSSEDDDAAATPRFKVGVKSDVWSLGCILYNLVYGHTPFQHIKTLVGKIRAITDTRHPIPFPPLPPPHSPHLVDVLRRCLERDPRARASVGELLRHPYLKGDDTTRKRDEGASSTLMEQVQMLTPRRMSALAKMVEHLSSTQPSPPP